jgi:hypothetical protein
LKALIVAESASESINRNDNETDVVLPALVAIG